MTRNAHDEARELIALGDGVSEAQQVSLRRHLDECEACNRYADTASEVARALRAVPLVADARLVRATQMRVRFHASRLRETRERFWLVGMACLGVGLSATLTVPILWRLFAWMGEWAGVSSWMWETGFAVFWITPALVVGALLLTRGTHLNKDGEKHWR